MGTVEASGERLSVGGGERRSGGAEDAVLVITVVWLRVGILR